jgi:hypothetical protein
MGDDRSPGQDVVESVGDVRVVVEAEHCGRLRQLASQRSAVPFGEAADRHHRPTGIGGGQQRVDAVPLGGLDEPAGVHDDGVGVISVGGQLPAAAFQPRRELLRVDLVTGAAQRDEGDGSGHAAQARAPLVTQAA